MGYPELHSLKQQKYYGDNLNFLVDFKQHSMKKQDVLDVPVTKQYYYFASNVT